MATVSAQLSVGTGATVLLWQTSTGMTGDTALGGQVFRAATFNDPLPIVIENTDAANPVYLGGSDVTSGTGLKLPAGGSLTYNVVGSDSLYAIATGGTVVVAVAVGRQ